LAYFVEYRGKRKNLLDGFLRFYNNGGDIIMEENNYNRGSEIIETRGTIKSIFLIVVKAIKWIKEKSKTENGWKIIHWFFFGFSLSLIPLAFAIGQDCMTVKMTVNEIKEKYAPDFMLMVFAVAVNMGSCTVSYLGKVKIGRLAISITTMMYCVFAYTHLHNQNTKLLTGTLNILCNIAMVVLIINTLIGIFLQVVPEK